MRHRVATSQFNRDTNARKGMLLSLVRNLTEQGSITTTQAKAKELMRLYDPLVSRAQSGTLNDRRILHRTLGKRDIVNTLVDQIAPAMSDRSSGFTTSTVVGKRRGDNALLVKVSLINMPEQVGSLKKPVEVKDAKSKKSTTARHPVPIKSGSGSSKRGSKKS